MSETVLVQTCIREFMSKYTNNHPAGSIQLGLKFINVAKSLMEKVETKTLTNQQALDNLLASKVELNKQFSSRAFVQTVVDSMITAETITYILLDMFQSNPNDPAHITTDKKDFPFNWQSVVQSTDEMYLTQYGVREYLTAQFKYTVNKMVITDPNPTL